VSTLRSAAHAAQRCAALRSAKCAAGFPSCRALASVKHHGSDYAAILGNGREVGGLRLDTRVTVGSPMVLLYSRDLEATLRAVKPPGAAS
jgi:hypothetical protein